MSRCFPYPPPGYKKNGIGDEALIESIKKRQREEEKARKENKKQRKLEKKEKDRSSRENGKESKKRKHRHEKEKRHKGEKDQEGQRTRDSSKKRKRETENLEKSNLTEEHGQPVGSQNSSDSTLNSDSKRHKPSPAPENVHNSGSIIRIRLPLQRHKDPVMSLPIKEQPSPATAQVQRPLETPLKQYREQIERQSQPCSTSQNVTPEVKVKPSGPTKGVVPNHRPTSFLVPGKEKKNLSSMKTETVDSSQKKAAMVSLPAAKENQKFNSAPVDTPNSSATVPRPGTENQKHDRKPVDAPMVHRPATENQKHDQKPVDAPMAPRPGKEKQSHISSSESIPKESKSKSKESKSKSSSRRKQRIVTQFNDLFNNWVPLPVQGEGFGDEEWLFESKQKSEDGNRACEIDCGVETCGPAPPSLWPQAHFLPCADLYALPYAVPF